MKLSAVVRVIVATFLLSLSGVLLYAQPERGTLSGTVTDSTGAAVPQAKVTVTNVATNTVVWTFSNETGDYTLPNLPTGQHNAHFEQEAVTATGRNGSNLQPGDNDPDNRTHT